MAQCLVPSWIKTNMWQITWIFLPSYSSSIWLSIFTFSKYCNCFRQILYDYFQDCHHITCTNAFEGQSWKQACLCLSLDCLLWLTIKPVNNILVKSWNTYWLIEPMQLWQPDNKNHTNPTHPTCQSVLIHLFSMVPLFLTGFCQIHRLLLLRYCGQSVVRFFYIL